jgi:RNA polymerase sigma-70 factor (ECF subfamily)
MGKRKQNDAARESPEVAAELEAIVAEHEAALLRYATRLLSNADAAQDVVQDTFIKLFRAWRAGTHPTAQLSAWLYRVTHNAAVDHIRSESRRGVLLMRHADEQQARTDAGSHAYGVSETAETAARLVSQLSLRERQLVILKVYEEKTYKEISEITGLSQGNVGYILHHTMKKLSAMLNEEIAQGQNEPGNQAGKA